MLVRGISTFRQMELEDTSAFVSLSQCFDQRPSLGSCDLTNPEQAQTSVYVSRYNGGLGHRGPNVDPTPTSI